MNLTPEQMAGLERDRLAGYYTPETGEWISQSSGSYIDPMTGLQVSYLNTSGASQSLFGDGMYIIGTGEPGSTYRIMDSTGADTGRTGTYSTTNFSWIDEAMLLVMAAAAAVVAMGAAAAAGAGTAGSTAGTGTMVNGAFLGEGALSGVAAWDGALAATGTAVTSTAVATAAPTVATTTAATSTTLSGIAGTAAKVLGVITSAVGLASATGSQQLAPGAGNQQLTPIDQTIIPGVSDSALIWGVVGLAAYLTIKD